MATKKKLPKNDTKSKAALEQEVVELKAQVAALKKQANSSQRTKQSKMRQSWRSIVIGFSVIIATLLLVLGNMFFWTGNTLVNNQRFISVVGPVIEQPPVQVALATYTTDKLFASVNVGQYVQSALPPRASFLAPQITSQLKSHTQSTLQTVLGRPKFQQYWNTALSKTQNVVIGTSKAYQGNGTFVISNVYAHLAQQLSGTKLSFLSKTSLPPKIGSITITTGRWLPALHKLSKNIGLYQFIATSLFVIFVGLAIFIGRNRRRVIILLNCVFAFFMLLTLIASRFAGNMIVTSVNQTYRQAAQTAYNTVFHSFVTQTAAILSINLLIVIVTWISGPYKSASAVKRFIEVLLSGHLHQLLFNRRENKFTLWVGKYRRYLEWASLVVIGLIMLTVRLTPRLVLIYALIILVCVLIIETLAASQKKLAK